MVHSIPFRLAWVEIECTVHVALLKRPINQFKPVMQIIQQMLRVHCPNIYTVARNQGKKTTLGNISTKVRRLHSIMSKWNDISSQSTFKENVFMIKIELIKNRPNFCRHDYQNFCGMHRSNDQNFCLPNWYFGTLRNSLSILEIIFHFRDGQTHFSKFWIVHKIENIIKLAFSRTIETNLLSIEM